MQSAIAILTYRRVHALKETLQGLQQHCPGKYPIAVFEDCGNADGTEDFLIGQESGASPGVRQTHLLATRYTHPDRSVFMGTCNLGVAGNSNRAIYWFLNETKADHLILMNDDLHVLGDFAAVYEKAHRALGIGMFCFNDYTYDASYQWSIVRSRGFNVKLSPRLTGSMISVTRALLAKIGYFDTRYTQFGNEHCDWTYRARFAGGTRLDGVDQSCGIDLEMNPVLLRHQEVKTSVTGEDRALADYESVANMREVAQDYTCKHYYRPFLLHTPRFCGARSVAGIPVHNLKGYPIVTDWAVGS